MCRSSCLCDAQANGKPFADAMEELDVTDAGAALRDWHAAVAASLGDALRDWHAR